ncbi:hypothetical protein M758_3G172700 [Ceratodon purpureus]|nr:hypothetical protein M758_3G172700 [Ceratodon purpureus]
MTGLFQIFDRYRALTRSKSIPKKVTAGSHGQPLPGGERDPSCINFAYHMFQDESGHRRATLAGPERLPQVEGTREPRRSSIDNSEVMVAKAPEIPKDIQPAVEARPQPPRTSLDSRPKPRLSFYFKEDASVDDTSASSAKEVPTSVPNEPPGNPSNGLLQRRSSDPTVVATRLSVDGKLSGSEDKEKKSRDFKGMIKGPFKRKGHRGNSHESTGSSGSSFDLKETEQLRKVSELQTERKEGSNNLYLSGQDGLGEDEEYKDFSVFTGSPGGWLESREGSTPRLTVELKDGPQLTRKDDQRVLIDDRSRLSGLEDSDEHTTQNSHALVPFGFKGSPNVIDYEDLRNMQRDRARKSVEGRESPGRPFDGKAATSRFSVDGTSAPRQSSGTPRRSVDGRETYHHPLGPGQNRFAQYVQRSLEAASPLSLRRDNSWANSPGRTVDGAWDNDMEDSRWKASSVVAKLMGLEELPNFDVVNVTDASSPVRHYPSLQRTAYYLQPDESPSRDDDDSYQVFGTDEVVTPLRKNTKFMSGVPLALVGRQQATSVSTPPRLQVGSPISPENKGNLTPASPKHLSVSPKHHMTESMPQVFKHQFEQKASSEGLYSDMDHRLRQLGLKNSIQERKTLKQILEAMHLKGLLQPPRHMEPDWKRNLSKQGSSGAVAKSLFDNKKDRFSSYMGDSFKEDIFGLDYKDIPMYISAQKAKSSAGVHIPDGSKSPSRRSGEASIVVMKPLNAKSASKLALANASVDLPLEKEHGTVRETSAFRASLTSGIPIATLEKDSSISTNNRSSSRSEASTVSNKLRPRSRSVDSRGQDNVEELPLSVRQRRERIAARTARAKTEGGDILLRDSPRSARSLSPVVKSSAKSSSPARSAFGSSVGQTGDAKSRVKPSIEKKYTKSTTQVIKKAKLSRETLKERTGSEEEVTKVPSRSREDSKSVAGDVDKIAALDPWGKAEVAVLRSKSSVSGGCDDQSGSALSVDEKNYLEERCREFLDSAADSCSESLDITLERSRNGSPINVMSPTFTSFESRSSRHSRHSSDRSLDGFYDTQERYESKLEDSELHTDSDAALYTDQGSSDVSMSRESQVEELGLNAVDSSEASPPGFLVRRKGHEGRGERLAERVEQPSPISVLNNINFHEGDSTPSPTSEKAGFVSLQDCSVSDSGEDREEVKTPVWQPTDPSTPPQLIPALTGDPLKDLIYKVARSLNLDDQNSFLNKPTLEIQVPYVPDMFSPTSLNSIPSSFSSKEDEKAYVRHIIMASGVTEEATAPKEWPRSGQLMKTEFFDQLEEHLELRESARKQNAYLSGEERTEYLKQALDRRLLFDSVNNILERKFYPYYNPQPWGSQTFRKKPMGAKLVEEIWEELKSIHTCTLDDDTLYTILQKDFTQRGEKWVDFSAEIGEIGMEIEEMILDELMDATVQEWSGECKFL